MKNRSKWWLGLAALFTAALLALVWMDGGGAQTLARGQDRGRQATDPATDDDERRILWYSARRAHATRPWNHMATRLMEPTGDRGGTGGTEGRGFGREFRTLTAPEQGCPEFE
jgi:hypothetical protein